MDQLRSLGTLHVRQKYKLLGGNKYVVVTPGGEEIFHAKEDAGALAVMFQGKDRSFHVDIHDSMNQEVITLRRPYTFGPAKMDVRVHGRLTSVVRVKPTFMKPVLNINDAHDQLLFKVKGPYSTTIEADFEIFDKSNCRIGCIRKQWGGALNEAFTDADQYLITFPEALDASHKAAILSTCLFIDFLYYDK